MRRLWTTVPYRNPGSSMWHSGRVVGVRRPPAELDDRIFVRLELYCGAEDVEVNDVVLELTATAPIPAREKLCRGCFQEVGTGEDTADSPDRAPGVETWRQALARRGDTLLP